MRHAQTPCVNPSPLTGTVPVADRPAVLRDCIKIDAFGRERRPQPSVPAGQLVVDLAVVILAHMEDAFEKRVERWSGQE